MSFLRQGLMAVGVGAAVWLSFGALAVTGQTSASRLGLLPPFWALLPAIAIAVLPAFWRRLEFARPALLLALFVFLPWLPIAIPAPFLLWLGPMTGLLWIGTVVSALALARPRWPAAVANALADARRAPWLAAALALAIYGGAAWQLTDRLPGGDEPHYLIIADSLLRDGDLRIENNHQAHQYLAYIDGELKPDYLRRGADGQIYSIHAPGLAALVLPAFALFGYRGASLFLVLLSAAGAGLLWRVSWRMTGQSGAAWFGWAVATLSAPFLFHAFTIYPDATASVIVLTGVVALVRAAELSSTRLVLHGALLAALPWLHTRYAVLAAALGVAISLRLSKMPDRRRRIGLLLAVPALSAIGWFAFFAAIYGTPNPAAPYGEYTQTTLWNVPRGLLGMLFDQQFGLLATAPALIVSVVGLGWLLFRPARVATDAATSDRRLAIELLAVIAPYVLATSSYQMWWGGWSAPARFLVPIVLTLGLPAAMLRARLRTRTARASAMLALVIGLSFTAMLLLVDHGRLVYNDRDGFALWTDWAGPIVDIAYGLPSFFREPRDAFAAQVAVWIGVLALAWALLTLWERRLERVATGGDRVLAAAWARSGPIYGAVFVPTVYACGTMLALALSWTVCGLMRNPVAGLRSDVAQMDFLHHLRERHRPHVLDYAPLGPPLGQRPAAGVLQLPRLEPESEATRRVRLVSASRRVPRNGPPFLAFDVPAGRYRVEPSITGKLAGKLEVLVGRSAVPIQTYDLSALQDGYKGQSLSLPLTLPTGVYTLTVRADDAASACVRQVRLYPDAVIGAADDDFPGVAAVQAARYGDVAVFAMSTSAYLEPGGWWVRPRERAPFILSREQTRALWRLVLRNGPRENRIKLEAGRWAQEVALAPGQEQVVDVPASNPRSGQTLGLVVTAEEGFRPSAIERTSGDHRSLGVWIGVLPPP
jgi:hypothetical protein